jgi:hypothetical protein
MPIADCRMMTDKWKGTENGQKYRGSAIKTGEARSSSHNRQPAFGNRQFRPLVSGVPETI